jgi:hypothetical protein
VAEGQETDASDMDVPPLGLTAVCVAQVDPFQRSARAPLVCEPTAVQCVVSVQATSLREEPETDGVVIFDQVSLSIFQAACSWVEPTIRLPTLMQYEDDVQATP